MKPSLLLVFLSLSGCSTLLEVAFEQVTNTDIGSDYASCMAVRQGCSGGYSEWTRKDGEKSCACNK